LSVNLDLLLVVLNVSEENINLFTVRHSKKAKRLIFNPSIRHGFEIILPRFYDDNWVLETVRKSKFTIEKRLAEIKEARRGLRPTLITLPPIGKSWKVTYRGINHKDSDEVVIETSTTLEVPEKALDVFWAPMVLQKWLHKKALQYLPNHLDNVSSKLTQSYSRVAVKKQKTRWGSCSIKRNINLNRNLMLMPFECIDYVLHHEVVHLKVLNHSSKFWKELGGSFPNYKKSLAQLKYIERKKLPEWALV